MIEHPAFAVDPWNIREDELQFDLLAQAESVFALSNGHVGLRGNLDEGEPFGMPGTYLNGFFETRPLPYAEAGYGYPEAGQTVVNVTNGKLIRLLVDDEPLDVRYGQLISHTRTLDLRAGLLVRELLWRSPAGREVAVRSTRLVSFVHRSIAAIRYEVMPRDGDTRIVVQSELVTNETGTSTSADPRAAAVLRAPLVSERYGDHELRAVLVHRTAVSNLRMAAGMDHVVDGPAGTVTKIESHADLARLTVSAEIGHGESLTLTKLIAYGWSSQRSETAVRDQVEAALASARRSGWDELVTDQRTYLDDFWERADIELDGDAELQQAIRFGLFQTLQASARAERRAIPAKGLTGPGYDGHAFWDTEMFVLPVLSYALPHAAADALSWRHLTLDGARERAQQLGLEGAAFPWRTIRGQECSAYWPAGTAAFHINADIASAVLRYIYASGDRAFEREAGLELLVETARLWRSLGHHDADGAFHIAGVTGPDEYSAVADDNVYTNLMAQQNLRGAADVAARHPRAARALGVDPEEVAAWRDAAKAMYLPFDERLGVHPQAAGFTTHRMWDFEETDREGRYPLLLHYPYFDLYRSQVVKQSDLVLAMFLRGDAFTDEQKARNFAYYEALTVRDSSLSACTQAIMAAEVGHLDLAYDYLAEAALMDLDDLEHNTADGVHIASLAGGILAVVAGLGGMRDYRGELTFRPRLPPALDRICFRVTARERLLRIEVIHDEARYRLVEGDSLTIRHEGEELTLRNSEEVVRRWSAPRPGPRPTQPAGRAPARRRAPAGHDDRPREAEDVDRAGRAA